MKKLIPAVISIGVMALSSQASASTTIAGIENVNLLDLNGSVTSSNNQFITRPFDASIVPANDPSIKEVLTDIGAPALDTYVLSIESGAYLDISFGDTVTGSNDLALFFASGTQQVSPEDVVDNVYTDPSTGKTYDVYIDVNGDSRIVTTTFDLDILNGDGSVASSIIDVSPILTFDLMQDVDGLFYPVTAAIIDLDGLGLLAPNQALEEFRIFLGNDTFPTLSAVGYTDIPLPLPVILFTSGLAMLGLFGRRKTP